MTCKKIGIPLLLPLLLLGTGLAGPGCGGNYSNEDLEFMNAVPARQDFVASIPLDITPANEAELARDTHSVIRTFNGALDFLKVADVIRTYPPTSRIPNGRVWGPAPDANHPGWQWQFVMTRDPDNADQFDYHFDEQPIGAGDQWSTILEGDFLSAGGARRGVGHFTLKTDDARTAGFPFAAGDDGSLLRTLQVTYSTAEFPISVMMMLEVYPNASNPDPATTSTIVYTYEALESGQGGMQFVATDSTGKSVTVVSRWLPSGQGRADATWMDPSTGLGATWTECWDASFVSVYDNRPWTPLLMTGDPTLCPDIPAL
jgi:hypothetical protein